MRKILITVFSVSVFILIWIAIDYLYAVKNLWGKKGNSEFDKLKRRHRVEAWFCTNIVIALSLIFIFSGHIIIGWIWSVILAPLIAYGIGSWEIQATQGEKERIEFQKKVEKGEV